MASAPKTTSVTCPKCGHTQREPVGAYSTVCKKCRGHFRLDEIKAPAKPVHAAPEKATVEKRKITCFQCGTDLDVPVAAESTMCKRCSSHVDLRDYEITATVSKNFRTYGRLLIQEKGYVLNTDSRVGEAIIKGRFIGKITADRLLEIHSTATIKGSFTTNRLVIPAGNRFRWPEALRIGGADIGGEFVANIISQGTIVLRSTARYFGDIEAGNLVVETGAVLVGSAKIGNFPAPQVEATSSSRREESQTPAEELRTRSTVVPRAKSRTPRSTRLKTEY
jgi:cytoskeletal protein CcmA (bactofilin family)